MAALTRLPSSSIFPKRSCGFEPRVKLESGEFVSIQLRLLMCGYCRSGGDRFHDLRRQAKPHVFGHYFEFLHVAKAFPAQESHSLLDQVFWRRGSSGQGNRLGTLQPLGLDVVETVDQMRLGPQISRDFHEAVRVRTVLRPNHEKQICLG